VKDASVVDHVVASRDACTFDAGSVVCNTLVPPCTPVTIAVSTAAEPTFTGGAIVAGSYALTSATAYEESGCTGTLSFPELAATYAFTATGGTGTLNSSDRLEKSGVTEGKSGTGTYTTSGMTMTVVDSCGMFGTAVTSSYPYTATPTSFTYDSTLAPGGFVQEANGSFCGHLVLTFTKM
jgi:hypothetical protein